VHGRCRTLLPPPAPLCIARCARTHSRRRHACRAMAGTGLKIWNAVHTTDCDWPSFWVTTASNSGTASSNSGRHLAVAVVDRGSVGRCGVSSPSSASPIAPLAPWGCSARCLPLPPRRRVNRQPAEASVASAASKVCKEGRRASIQERRLAPSQVIAKERRRRAALAAQRG